MNEITPAELQPIIEKSSEDFAAWFVNELLAYHSSDPRKKLMAFAPLEHLIVPGRDRAEDECLADIFRALGALVESNTQTHFKSGLAHAIAKFVREWKQNGWPQHSVAGSVNLLLRTGKFIGCSELVAIIDESWPLLPDLFGEEESAWDALFEAVAAVATKSDADRISKMVAAFHFRDYMAPMAFLALCRADKERFPMWLNKFRPHFFRLHQNPIEKRYAYMTALKFAKWVDADTMAKQLRLSRLVPDAEFENTDNWLLESLVAEQNSPLELTEDYRLQPRYSNNLGSIEVLSVETDDAVQEYNFFAVLGGAWCKSFQNRQFTEGSLVKKFSEQNAGCQEVNRNQAKAKADHITSHITCARPTLKPKLGTTMNASSL